MVWHTLRKNLESLPFCYHNLIISLQPSAILIILVPWDSGSMHGEVTAALNCSYWLSMITEDQQCVHLWVYFISCVPGQGKRRWGEIDTNFLPEILFYLISPTSALSARTRFGKSTRLHERFCRFLKPFCQYGLVSFRSQAKIRTLVWVVFVSKSYFSSLCETMWTSHQGLSFWKISFRKYVQLSVEISVTVLAVKFPANYN